jgi:mannitol/fructose-specific phosphotransferase system IIA component (Ntr-type)
MAQQTIQLQIQAADKTQETLKKMSLQHIANHADLETLQKIAELIQKPNACEKFKKALNNSLVKAMF